MIELGCGYADLGNSFHELGCDVNSVDARIEHINVAKLRYPHINSFVLDCDDLILDKKYDIVLHWGLLYHLKDIEKNLTVVCDKCDYLFLETEVIDGDNEDDFIHVNENGYDQAYNNIGSRPSYTKVEKILTKNDFKFVLIKDPILNTPHHIYDWNITNSKRWANGMRRFWICWRNNVESPLG